MLGRSLNCITALSFVNGAGLGLVGSALVCGQYLPLLPRVSGPGTEGGERDWHSPSKASLQSFLRQGVMSKYCLWRKVYTFAKERNAVLGPASYRVM